MRKFLLIFAICLIFCSPCLLFVGCGEPVYIGEIIVPNDIKDQETPPDNPQDEEENNDTPIVPPQQEADNFAQIKDNIKKSLKDTGLFDENSITFELADGNLTCSATAFNILGIDRVTFLHEAVSNGLLSIFETEKDFDLMVYPYDNLAIFILKIK